MSCYVEEPESEREYISINNEYWLEFSNIQRKRKNKVLAQMRKIWFNTYKILKMVNSYSVENSNELMNKIYNLFFLELKSDIDYYNEEKILNRKKSNYLSKKINKMKKTIQKI